MPPLRQACVYVADAAPGLAEAALLGVPVRGSDAPGLPDGHAHVVGARAALAWFARVGVPERVSIGLVESDGRGALSWVELPDRAMVVARSRFAVDHAVQRGVPRDRVTLVPPARAVAMLLATAPPPPTRLRRALVVGGSAAGLAELRGVWDRVAAHLAGARLSVLERGTPDAVAHEAIGRSDLVITLLDADGGPEDGLTARLVDAAALARPLLVEAHPCLLDVAAPHISALAVSPGDVDGFGAALVRLASRPGELQRLGAGGQALAAACDVSVVRPALEQIFGLAGAS